MYLLDEMENIVDAELSLGVIDSEHCIIVESSGGSNPNRGIIRRNPQYNKLLSLIFMRLNHAGIQISKIVLDSERVANLPVSERTVLLDFPYPVDLSTVDLEKFRKMVGRKIAAMHRHPNATKSGNNQKRLRICLSEKITPEQLMFGNEKVIMTDTIIDHMPTIIETEREYLRLARCGQGRFRETLIKRYDGQCPITGITNPELLIASHIKPWSACTSAERLDPHNGILLSVMIDRLFDRGLITFSHEGKVMMSPRLSELDRILCRLDLVKPVTMSEGNKRYMEYHREINFKCI